ncbi:RHS repeat-associated core domain-containing protein [Lachnospiraceae bacterium 46-61]
MNGETHKYIFDGWSITAETNKDGELKSREVRGYGLVKKEIDNNQYYYHQNEHGDITHLTNIDEEIENSYQYDVFGNIREQQENVENVFKYAGEQQDQETEQYYLRARFYNPVIARFTQEDVYRGDGLNLYVYVVNNPLLWIDPSGHAKCNQNIYGLDPSDIPSVREGKFNRFFNSLTPDELDDLWKDERIKKTISSRLRQPGKLHEWHMVAATPKFKRWGLTAERIKETRSLIKDVEFVNPAGKHGENGSTTAHNEILDIIDSSIDYDMFVRRLNTWADYRLKDGRNSLPQGLRY